MGRFESQWALDNPLKQLARRATGRTENDDLASGAASGRHKGNSTLNRDMHLQAEGEREARAEDCNAAHGGCNQVNKGCTRALRKGVLNAVNVREGLPEAARGAAHTNVNPLWPSEGEGE